MRFLLVEHPVADVLAPVVQALLEHPALIFRPDAAPAAWPWLRCLLGICAALGCRRLQRGQTGDGLQLGLIAEHPATAPADGVLEEDLRAAIVAMKGVHRLALIVMVAPCRSALQALEEKCDITFLHLPDQSPERPSP